MLEQILATKREEIERLYRQNNVYCQSVNLRDIATYPFVEALRAPKRCSALIAEVKKASPSKGLIREDFDPVWIAKQYEQSGADCLSVLTDVHYFQGHQDYIALIKREVKLPVLRKDFIIDSIQIYESINLGADCILLIAKALTTKQLVDLYDKAQQAGLDCLVEVSTKEELDIVIRELSPPLMGINNRDLNTFQTNPNQTIDLMPHISSDIIVISESGIHNAQTMRELESHGVRGFLIGEHLMRQTDIRAAVATLYEDVTIHES